MGLEADLSRRWYLCCFVVFLVGGVMVSHVAGEGSAGEFCNQTRILSACCSSGDWRMD